MENARSFVIKLVYNLLAVGMPPCPPEESCVGVGRINHGMLNEVMGEWLWIHK